ncbi:MAG: hypothetical protein HZB53_20325 [Chloroflexi bacterium]|nr:hypothetical protein [Chloroflexota bacterium]
MGTRRTEVRTSTTRVSDTQYIVIESPIPASRALGPRRPLAMVLSGGALVLTVWVLGVLASAGSMAAGAFPAVLGGGAMSRPPVSAPLSAAEAPVEAALPPAAPRPALLQSRSADPLPPLSARADGRTAVSSSPTVLIVYVPDGYYPQPASAAPPTREAAQQTAAIVQQVASGNEAKAVEAARALRAAQPQYATRVASELQTAAEPSPRYNQVRQVLIALDPSFATQTQTETQVRSQTQTQVQPQAQNGTQGQAATNTNAPAPATRPNVADREQVAARVNALIMGTVPAYAKIPLGLNEATLQVNTLVAPTPAFLFDQRQIRSALCEIGSGEVVAVHDTVPNAWELKTTFTPKDPVRWFTVKDSFGKPFYLPNYLDAQREVQVGDRFSTKEGCNVELIRR